MKKELVIEKYPNGKLFKPFFTDSDVSEIFSLPMVNLDLANAKVADLVEENSRLRKALEFYANRASYCVHKETFIVKEYDGSVFAGHNPKLCSPYYEPQDVGTIARTALAATEKIE